MDKKLKTKELTEEELWKLIKDLADFIFPDDFINELEQEIKKPTKQTEIPFL